MSRMVETEMWFGDPPPEEQPLRDDVFALLDRTWTSKVIMRLNERPHGYLELHRSIPGISQKMLTETLYRLKRNGLVDRRVVEPRPRHVEYRLTADGSGLARLLHALQLWDWERLRATEQPLTSGRGISGPLSA